MSTPFGPVRIQPQRTNIEQFFRAIKRSHRRRTDNAAASRLLRTMLADTPLVRNLENAPYMNILLNGKPSLEAVFAEIDIETLRKECRKAQDAPERIPAGLKPLIATTDFPEKLVKIVEKAAA